MVKFWSIYYKIAELFFFFFLFGVLSFGRPFSLIHINTPFLPIYITEFILLFNLPLLFYKINELTKLPKLFFTLFLTFFCLSSLYLFFGLSFGKFLALRDVTLSLYLLFLPITFIFFNTLNKIKTFAVIVIISSIINLFLTRCLMIHICPLVELRDFLEEIKFFNQGLYLMIACAFLIPFYGASKYKVYRLFVLIALSVYVYMLIMISKSSLWVASFVVVVFLAVELKSRFLKFCAVFVPVFICVSSVIFYVDSITPSVYYRLIVSREIESIGLFAAGVRYNHKAAVNEKKEKLPAKPAIVIHKDILPPAENLPLSLPKTKKPLLYSNKKNLGNINWRLSVWMQTLKFGLGSPLFGRGFGVYPVYDIYGRLKYPKQLCADADTIPAHNHIFTIFFKMGFLGLGLFLFLNLSFFRHVLMYKNKCKSVFLNNLLISLLAAFLFWHSLALFFDVIDSPPTSIFLWVIMGLTFAVIEIDRAGKAKVA